MSHGTLAISTIEPSRPQAAQVAVFGHPPHTPYPDTPVVLPQSTDRSFLCCSHHDGELHSRLIVTRKITGQFGMRASG
jgi:hypothetical protein